MTPTSRQISFRCSPAQKEALDQYLGRGRRLDLLMLRLLGVAIPGFGDPGRDSWLAGVLASWLSGESAHQLAHRLRAAADSLDPRSPDQALDVDQLALLAPLD